MEYSKDDLPALDRKAQRNGTYEEWMMSLKRAHIAGPGHVVRVLNWSNIDEVCHKAGLDIHKVSAALHESIATGEVLFITYDEG